MRYRLLGNTGWSVSRITLGTWSIGGGECWGPDPDDAESIRAIHAALDAGVNLIDTAPAYGWGRSEQVVGKALAGKRDKVILATKCGLWWDDERGSYFTDLDGKSLRRSLRPDTIQLEVERSLARLHTDHIDLYQVHWPSVPPDFTPVQETIQALLKLKKEGKIRAMGVCNVTPDELKEYLREGPIATDQFRYSMLHREPEAEILPLCIRHKVATLTYMSLEQGLLTGRVKADTVFDKGQFRNNEAWNPWFIPVNRPKILSLLAQWQPLKRKYECSIAQLVLAWTLAQPGVTHVICGARKVPQVRENCGGADIELSDADLLVMTADIKGLGKPVAEEAVTSGR